MKITSPKFENNAVIPVKYTCKGENISPPLVFGDVPEGAKSLVLTVEDIDASPKTWIHWFVFNIPPRIGMIEEGRVPDGAIEGYANGGDPGYEGPCPIYFKDTHHYHFNLLALNTQLDSQEHITKDDIASILQDHALSHASLVGVVKGTGEKA